MHLSGESRVVGQMRDSIQRVSSGYSFARLKEHSLEAAGTSPTPVPVDSALLSNASLLAMANDPAHGGKISEGNIQEAVVGTMAIHLKALPDLKRENTGGSEFIDSKTGLTWDVKSPISPMPSDTWWVFDPNHHKEVLSHDMSTGDNILLDLSRCNSADGASLVQLLEKEMTPEEKSKLLVFFDATQNPLKDGKR